MDVVTGLAITSPRDHHHRSATQTHTLECDDEPEMRSTVPVTATLVTGGEHRTV